MGYRIVSKTQYCIRESTDKKRVDERLVSGDLPQMLREHGLDEHGAGADELLVWFGLRMRRKV
jgi:hypothetical protein